jgi:3-phenylpropionate/trans-cinnamate dioxygenase ferredoxin reductase component
MPDRTTFVIAGAALAGAKAAEALRDEGFDGRVILIGAEPVRPYERPPLSKGYLAGSSPRDEAFVHAEDYYRERDIHLRDGTRIAALDPQGHSVELEGGERVAYDRLLLATGAVPKRPPIPGGDLDGVVVLRSLADADALRARLEGGGHLAVIGAGWIGCEAGASARQLGAEVTLIEAAATPLERVLGPELGEFYAGVHREHGVNLMTEARVERIASAGDGLAVHLEGAAPVECDTLLLAVGVAPDTALAEAAGIEVDDGIVTDELLRTSAPDVYAAGDVASAFHPRYGRRVRVEHWANAIDQGAAAARSMLDRGEPYAKVPYFFSDQFDTGMEYAGLHSPGDRLVLRSADGGRPLRALWLDGDDRVTAGLHVDDWDAMEEIRDLVERRAQVDPETAQPSAS